ncbi:hypothetical protein [Butyrivibrio sp. YAB3001]|uniref:hypothetical protein n=1 Tax=Butyrivibrio sp. YAB3001 TaxID=1520812 RepID=UPI0008F6811F|nr:hypothetical protein [Butyrivibrio sp. YAB3001]SFB66971.1 hypothetical protein SAMN02910398_00084 [Butyrivibrio sp. YAB3001]
MKLKYYMRGMGIGIILTAMVMGFALGGRKATISNAEVIKRAKALGMVEPDSSVLAQNNNGDKSNENASASGSSLDKTGEEIFEKVDEKVALSSKPVSSVDENAKEGETQETEETGISAESTESVTTSNTETPVKENETVANIDESSSLASLNERLNELAMAKSDESTSNTSQIKAEDTSTSASVAASSEALATSSTSEQVKEIPESDTALSAGASASSSVETPPVTSTNFKVSQTKTVTVPGGYGSDQVARLLYDEGIIDSSVAFNKYLIENKKDRIIRSGVKTIPAGSSYFDIAEILCTK